MLNSSTTAYRYDIDGLRALAVLSVTFFHLNPSWLPGGFLGVDIFFVISGFLITSILYREISSGTFSFKNFYTKRIKRILPAFFFALFAGLFLAYTTFLLGDALEVGRSAFASVIFLANFFFSLGGGYFDVASEEKMFLHIWSLSIEEQFYFIFPLLLIVLLKFSFTRKNLLSVLVSIGVALLATSVIDLEKLGIGLDIYYLPHLRFVEMLVGSILAVYIARKSSESEPNLRMREIGSGTALVVLIICFVLGAYFLPPYFPGVLALVPCVATAVLLYANRSNTVVARLMSLSPIVWVGKISYSLYLWHWIVLAYIRYFYGSGPLPFELLLLASIAMLLMSIVSYYLVEQPLRHVQLSFGKTFGWLYFVPTVAVVLFTKLYALGGGGGVPPELSGYTIAQPGDDVVEYGVLRGDRSKEPTVLIAGDSHTAHMYNFMDILGKHEGWCALVSNAPSCPFFFDYIFEFRGQDPDYLTGRLEYLTREFERFDTIVLSNYWGSKYYREDPLFLPKFEKTIQRLLASRKRVIVFNTMYKVRIVGHRQVHSPKINRVINGLPGMIISRSSESYSGATAESGSLGDFRGEDYWIYRKNASLAKEIVMRYPEVRWIDLQSLLPNSYEVGGMSIFANNDHLNHYGSGVLANLFIASGQRLVPTSE